MFVNGEKIMILKKTISMTVFLFLSASVFGRDWYDQSDYYGSGSDDGSGFGIFVMVVVAIIYFLSKD